MKDKFAFFVGNGRRVRFWEDGWCGDEALSISFPSLYALATSKEAWVAEVWDTLGEDGGWNPCFSRPFNDWEMGMVERFLLSLQGKKVIINLEDRWKEAKGGNFTVKSFYNALEGGSTVPFPRSIIWSPYVPTKVGFFAWEATWGKVLTLDQLKKRGWALPNRCYLCGATEESINHLLIHCTKARVLWDLLFNLFGYYGFFLRQ